MEHMEQMTGLDTRPEATAAAVLGWMAREANENRAIAAPLNYRMTLSTLSLDARELADLSPGRAAMAMGDLLKTCRLLGRAEILIERLEEMRRIGETRPLVECFNAVQSAIIAASRRLNRLPPRIALEKRGGSHDVRVYLELH